MLQLLSALGLFATVLLVLACLRLWRTRQNPAAGLCRLSGRFPRFELLLVCCAGLSFTALAVTGFAVRLRGEALAGYTLLLHVSCGGVLAGAFTLVLILLASRYSFETGSAGDAVCCPLHRCLFWLLAVALIGTIVTPLVAMLPLAGTHDQELLVAWHRGFALAAVLLALCLASAEARVRAGR
jgi:hypothetical protein